MNSSAAALALFLLAALLLQAQAQPGGPSSFCCFNYTKKPIPPRLLESYEVTSTCSLPAVLFYTKGGKMVCADPQAEWTQNRVRNLPQKGQRQNP